MIHDLRRISRATVCCRAIVLDRYGVWSGVTEDVSAGGCQIVTARLLRPGTTVAVTLSSDLFPEELECFGEAAWAASDRLGIRFLDTPTRSGAPTAKAWFEKLLENGIEQHSASTSRLVPSVLRADARRSLSVPAGARLNRGDGSVIRLTAVPN